MFKSHCNAHPQRLDLFEMGELLERSRSENEAIIRAKCQTSYLGAHVALCRVLGRFKMFVDTNDIDLSTHLMLDGYWEMWVTEAMCRLVRPGMVVADIGANLGYFALLMAELVGPDGFVHAFEPNPHIARQLRQSLDINSFSGRHAVHQVALAAIDGEPMAFVVPPTQPKNARLAPFSGELPENATLLHTRRLDSDTAWHKIEFAKIDVEGAEELLWAGAQGLLDGSRLKTVVLEFTPIRYSDPAAFLDKLLAPGFSLSWIDPWNGIRPITGDELWSRNSVEDVMLVLQR